MSSRNTVSVSQFRKNVEAYVNLLDKLTDVRQPSKAVRNQARLFKRNAKEVLANLTKSDKAIALGWNNGMGEIVFTKSSKDAQRFLAKRQMHDGEPAKASVSKEDLIVHVQNLENEVKHQRQILKKDDEMFDQLAGELCEAKGPCNVTEPEPSVLSVTEIQVAGPDPAIHDLGIVQKENWDLRNQLSKLSESVIVLSRESSELLDTIVNKDKELTECQNLLNRTKFPDADNSFDETLSKVPALDRLWNQAEDLESRGHLDDLDLRAMKNLILIVGAQPYGTPSCMNDLTNECPRSRSKLSDRCPNCNFMKDILDRVLKSCLCEPYAVDAVSGTTTIQDRYASEPRSGLPGNFVQSNQMKALEYGSTGPRDTQSQGQDQRQQQEYRSTGSRDTQSQGQDQRPQQEYRSTGSRDMQSQRQGQELGNGSLRTDQFARAGLSDFMPFGGRRPGTRDTLMDRQGDGELPPRRYGNNDRRQRLSQQGTHDDLMDRLYEGGLRPRRDVTYDGRQGYINNNGQQGHIDIQNDGTPNDNIVWNQEGPPVRLPVPAREPVEPRQMPIKTFQASYPLVIAVFPSWCDENTIDQVIRQFSEKSKFEISLNLNWNILIYLWNAPPRSGAVDLLSFNVQDTGRHVSRLGLGYMTPQINKFVVPQYLRKWRDSWPIAMAATFSCRCAQDPSDSWMDTELLRAYNQLRDLARPELQKNIVYLRECNQTVPDARRSSADHPRIAVAVYPYIRASNINDEQHVDGLRKNTPSYEGHCLSGTVYKQFLETIWNNLNVPGLEDMKEGSTIYWRIYVYMMRLPRKTRTTFFVDPVVLEVSLTRNIGQLANKNNAIVQLRSLSTNDWWDNPGHSAIALRHNAGSFDIIQPDIAELYNWNTIFEQADAGVFYCSYGPRNERCPSFDNQGSTSTSIQDIYRSMLTLGKSMNYFKIMQCPNRKGIVLLPNDTSCVDDKDVFDAILTDIVKQFQKQFRSTEFIHSSWDVYIGHVDLKFAPWGGKNILGTTFFLRDLYYSTEDHAFKSISGGKNDIHRMEPLFNVNSNLIEPLPGYDAAVLICSVLAQVDEIKGPRNPDPEPHRILKLVKSAVGIEPKTILSAMGMWEEQPNPHNIGIMRSCYIKDKPYAAYLNELYREIRRNKMEDQSNFIKYGQCTGDEPEIREYEWVPVGDDELLRLLEKYTPIKTLADFNVKSIPDKQDILKTIVENGNYKIVNAIVDKIENPILYTEKLMKTGTTIESHFRMRQQAEVTKLKHLRDNMFQNVEIVEVSPYTKLILGASQIILAIHRPYDTMDKLKTKLDGNFDASTIKSTTNKFECSKARFQVLREAYLQFISDVPLYLYEYGNGIKPSLHIKDTVKNVWAAVNNDDSLKTIIDNQEGPGKLNTKLFFTIDPVLWDDESGVKENIVKFDFNNIQNDFNILFDPQNPKLEIVEGVNYPQAFLVYVDASPHFHIPTGNDELYRFVERNPKGLEDWVADRNSKLDAIKSAWQRSWSDGTINEFCQLEVVVIIPGDVKQWANNRQYEIRGTTHIYNNETATFTIPDLYGHIRPLGTEYINNMMSSQVYYYSDAESLGIAIPPFIMIEPTTESNKDEPRIYQTLQQFHNSEQFKFLGDDFNSWTCGSPILFTDQFFNIWDNILFPDNKFNPRVTYQQLFDEINVEGASNDKTVMDIVNKLNDYNLTLKTIRQQNIKGLQLKSLKNLIDSRAVRENDTLIDAALGQLDIYVSDTVVKPLTSSDIVFDEVETRNEMKRNIFNYITNKDDGNIKNLAQITYTAVLEIMYNMNNDLTYAGAIDVLIEMHRALQNYNRSMPEQLIDGVSLPNYLVRNFPLDYQLNKLRSIENYKFNPDQNLSAKITPILTDDPNGTFFWLPAKYHLMILFDLPSDFKSGRHNARIDCIRILAIIRDHMTNATYKDAINILVSLDSDIGDTFRNYFSTGNTNINDFFVKKFETINKNLNDVIPDKWESPNNCQIFENTFVNVHQMMHGN